MNLLGNLIAVVALCALVFAFISWKWPALHSFAGDLVRLSNIGESRSIDGIVSRKADAAITERYRLVKVGTDADHFDVCGAADIPIGICLDEPGAQHTTASIHLLGSARGTQFMRAAGSLNNGALLEPAANGRVQTLGVGAGTHHVVGRALQGATNAGDIIEVDVFYFLRVI